MPSLPPIVTFVAPSGTGKTTLLEQVIGCLVARGLRIAVVKHDAHRLELDKPGKDTWKFRRAGACRVAVAGETQMAVFSAVEGELTVGGVVAAHMADVDLVLSEGFRRSGLPMIRVHRAAAVDPSWRPPADPIAWVSDGPVEDVDVPVLSLDDPESVADFVADRFVTPALRAATTLALPLGPTADLALVVETAERLGDAFAAVLVVCAPDAAVPEGMDVVTDLRPGIGPLGGLLTALAAMHTPQLVFLGQRHLQTPLAEVERLLGSFPLADVVACCRDGLPEPTLARYSHRCLPAIHAARISGEHRMTGWWGQVRNERLHDPA